MTTLDVDNSRQTSMDIENQFSTFYIDGRLYGIDVMQVQEVTKAQMISRIPLAPPYVKGLINLRGQIATAIGMRNLFGLEEQPSDSQMNVVCQFEGNLLSFLVDKIGDVVEVPHSLFEPPPPTVPGTVRRFMKGVYKLEGNLLSIVEIEKIAKALNQNAGQKA